MKGLKQTRINKGLSRADIIKATGITFAQLSLIERGLQTPTIFTRKRLELLLAEKINWLDVPKINIDSVESDWKQCERDFRTLYCRIKSLPIDEKKAFTLSAVRHLKNIDK